MGINQIQVTSSPISPDRYNPAGKIFGALGRRSPAPDRLGGNGVQVAIRSQAGLMDFHRVNEKINLVAKSQRFYQQRLSPVNDAIERMKTQLEKIMKQFPPYPPESDERVRALRAYAGCRKLIDQLTIPPPDELLSPAMEEPAAAAEAPDM